MKLANKLFVLILAAFGLSLVSCSDIINTEENYQKELLQKYINSTDSLSRLNTNIQDLGWVKVGTMSHHYLDIANLSQTDDVIIYSIENTNKTGLFDYTATNGFPIIIENGESTITNQSIVLKFVASTYTIGDYHDTLYFNGNHDIYFPVKISVKY